MAKVVTMVRTEADIKREVQRQVEARGLTIAGITERLWEAWLASGAPTRPGTIRSRNLYEEFLHDDNGEKNGGPGGSVQRGN